MSYNGVVVFKSFAETKSMRKYFVTKDGVAALNMG